MRAILLAALLAAAVLAGCTATPPDAVPTSSAPVSAGPLPPLKAPTVLPDLLLGQGDGEPNIAVAPDGTIYVTPINHVYRSTDGGKTFTDMGTTQTDGHGDGDIAVDSTGRLHWLGLFGGRNGNIAIPYQHSDDKGDTFTDSIDLSSPDNQTDDGTGADREWIDAAPGGWIYTAWRDGSQNGIIAFRASSDNGATWSHIVKVGPDALTGPVVHGPMDGEVYIPMTTFECTGPGTPFTGSATCTYSIVLGHSMDHGAHWKTVPVRVPDQPAAKEPIVDEGTAIFPVAGVDANGTAYVAWSSQLPDAAGQTQPKHTARYGVYLTHSKDMGATWSAPVVISDVSHAAVLPFMAAGAAGRLAIVWYENTLGNPNDSLPDLWNVKLWESTTADAAAPQSMTVQLNSQPNHIGTLCTVGGACLFTAGDRSLLDYFEVALDGHGQPVVTWASSAGGTAIGVAAQPTAAHFGGVKDGTPLA